MRGSRIFFPDGGGVEGYMFNRGPGTYFWLLFKVILRN